MKISILTQLTQICLCWLMGMAAGFVYDAFKVLRRESGVKALAAFLDALFCIAVCFAMFVIGMSAGKGSIGISMITFALLGFACYVVILSGSIYKILKRAFRGLRSVLSAIFLPFRKIRDKLAETTESARGAVVQWLKRKREDKSSENAETEHSGAYRNYGDDDIWSIQPRR